MPPIPIYSHSPINAATADGVTSQSAEKSNEVQPPPTTTQNVPSSAAGNAYPRAQPGVAPSIPAPTGSFAAPKQQAALQSTPTRPLPSSGPAPPQPGTFPVPPGSISNPPVATSTGLPPPPKAGESLDQSTKQPFYPPQMSIPAPYAATTQSAQRGTSSAFAALPSPLERPPGYQQNPASAHLNQYQQAAQEARDREEYQRMAGASTGDGEVGVWDSVKGAMMAAGGKIAAAEEEVWKRINKDL
ncbi:hypothetical protein BD289DRAFT_149571 [Coniella lustricola]|uniref:Uncharacterized protein n=1 Tax=Coniella lustricola TaxID=2025994 RepID=A0A2T3AEP4_9PEZI|nr:hypothetical protein BD289DRAFT_149571 [Coniella lustricola]